MTLRTIASAIGCWTIAALAQPPAFQAPATSAAATQGNPVTAVEFEAASVKLAGPRPDGMAGNRMRGGPGSVEPGQFSCLAVKLDRLLQVSYEIMPYQLILGSGAFRPLQGPPNATLTGSARML